MKRPLARTLGLLAAICLAVAAGVVVFATRTDTLDALLARISADSNGSVRFEGVSGSLWRGAHIKRVLFGPTEAPIQAEDVALDLGFELGARRVVVHQLTIGTLVLPESDAAPLLPGSLSSPIALEIRSFSIRSIRSGSPLHPRALGSMLGQLSVDPEAWVVRQVRWQGEQARFTGSARVGARAPFPVSAVADATLPYVLGEESGTVRVPLSASGTLAALTVTGTAALPDGPALAARAAVAPFASKPLSRVEVTVGALNPRTFAQSLPRARLSAYVSLTATADGFAGPLVVANEEAGPLDRGRIPVVTARASLEWNPKRRNLAARALDVDGGGAGHFVGSAAWMDGIPSVEGVVNGLDLSRVLSTWRTTKLSGHIAAERQSSAVAWQVALTDAGRTVTGAGTWSGDRIAASHVVVTSGRSRLEGRAEYGFKTHRGEAQGSARHVDPSDFGSTEKGDLTGRFTIAGRWERPWQVSADVTLEQSRWRGYDLAGHARFAAQPGRFSDVDVALVSGANQVMLAGAFGRPDDHLRFQVEARELAALVPEWGGAIHAEGDLSGGRALPAIDFRVTADHLVHEQEAVTSLRAEGHLGAAASGRLNAHLRAVGFHSGEGPNALVLDQATVDVGGTRDDHTVAAHVTGAGLDADLRAQGALVGSDGWAGRVLQFANRGATPFTLTAPAPLTVDGHDLALSNAAFALGEGSVSIDHLTRHAGQWSSQGSAHGLPLALFRFLRPALDKRVHSTLALGGQWDVTLGQTLAGSATFRREAGDVEVLADPVAGLPDIRLNLSALELHLQLVHNRVAAAISAAGSGLGTLELSASTELTRRVQGPHTRWLVEGRAPLVLDGNLHFPDLRVVSRLLAPPAIDVAGQLDLSLHGRGTFAAPGLTGSAHASALAFRWPDVGARYTDGSLDLAFADDALSVKQLTLKGGSGTVTGTGEIGLTGGEAIGHVDLALKQFQVLARPDRQVVVSGSGGLVLAPDRLILTSQLKLDRADIRLADQSGPTLSEDVLVVGRPQPPPRPAASVPIDLDVSVDLNDHATVKGRGFDVTLGGKVNVSGRAGTLAAQGTVSVKSGTYNAYGQQLVIDHGSLYFSGPLINPAVDLLATRHNLAVQPGIQISGTMQNPRAQLVSNPDVPDTEKLSWLVLGHGMDASRQSDFGLLSTAAAGLLGAAGSSGLQSRIATQLGVDELSVTGLGGSQGGLITIGKKLTSDVSIAFQQGIEKAESLVRIKFAVTKQISVQGQTGIGENSVDVLWSFGFD